MALDRDPPRYAFRLKDLRDWHILEAQCWKCGHKADLAPADVMRGRSALLTLNDIEPMLRCRKCGLSRCTISVRAMPRN